MEGKSIGGGIQLKGEGKRKKMEENSESGGKTYRWKKRKKNLRKIVKVEGKRTGGEKEKKLEENSESGGKTYRWRHFDNIVKRK
jgi:hypothetical protein